MPRLSSVLDVVKNTPELAAKQLGASPMPEIAKFVSGGQTADIDEDTLELGKRHLLDTFASIVVSSDLKPAKLARDFAIFNGGKGDASHLLTTNDRVTILDAILANAITAHAAEINDFCPSAFVQPGPPIVSTIMAIGETLGSSGIEILRSLIVGYEISCRFPKALGIQNLGRAGISSHGLGPTFGAGAAAASLLKIPEDKIGYVMAYCAQQAAGSFNWRRDEEHIEKSFLFGGMPAKNGALAALLVYKGFTGVPDPFADGDSWLVSTTFIGPDSDLDRQALRDIGIQSELPLVAYKRYPVGGPTQPGVEGLLALIKYLDRDKVAKVLIEMPRNVDTFAYAAMPALNLRYLSAAILEDGYLDFHIAQSHDRMETSSIREKMERVHLVLDNSQDEEPRVESARVTVTLTDGQEHQIFIQHVLGFPAKPMSRSDVRAKAENLLEPKLGPKRTSELINMVWNIEALDDIRKIIPMLNPNVS